MVVYSWPWLVAALSIVLLALVGTGTFIVRKADPKNVKLALGAISAALVITGLIALVVLGFEYGLTGAAR